MITEITFEEIYEVWDTKLWPNRKSKIEPSNGMMFMGGYDEVIMPNYKPIFFAYKEGDTIIGVNSGFQTSTYAYRSRGIYVDPDHRGKGIGEQLLRAVINHAGENAMASIVWSIPRKESFGVYLKSGYHRLGEYFEHNMEFGPNCYAYIDLSNVW